MQSIGGTGGRKGGAMVALCLALSLPLQAAPPNTPVDAERIQRLENEAQQNEMLRKDFNAP